jgi:hypothetical protein
VFREEKTGSTQQLFQAIGQVVEEAIERHEERSHIPPPRRGRVQAIPFPNIQLADVVVCHALELLATGSTLSEAAYAVGVPVPALERGLAEYRVAWRHFLEERATGD